MKPQIITPDEFNDLKFMRPVYDFYTKTNINKDLKVHLNLMNKISENVYSVPYPSLFISYKQESGQVLSLPKTLNQKTSLKDFSILAVSDKNHVFFILEKTTNAFVTYTKAEKEYTNKAP